MFMKDEFLPLGAHPHIHWISAMARYVDGFLLPLPKAKLAAYRRVATKAAKIWREYGALDYQECVGDDLDFPFGVSFTKAAKAKPDELVVFSYIVYESRAQRNRINAKIVKDPRIAAMCNDKNAPFNPKRMAYGGFKVIVAG